MTKNKSVEFFDMQFQKQIHHRDFALNPFETVALEYLEGDVLDLGCGLGNLALEAGRRGHNVVAVDTCDTAIKHINQVARQESLPVQAFTADLETWDLENSYDTIVAIGLLMFFSRERSLELLNGIRERVNPGGRAIVNVLIEGTTYMGMFQSNHYYLFGCDELESHFVDWRMLSSRHDSFSAPEDTVKKFSTVIVKKPV